MKHLLNLISLLLPLALFGNSGVITDNSPDTTIIKTNVDGKGYKIEIHFYAGKSHNHPSMAIWLETMEQEFIQPLYVTKSFGTGVYRYGKTKDNQWEEGQKRYKAALPFFIHKWTKSGDKGFILPSPQHPVPDAYTAATPSNNFVLHTHTDSKRQEKLRLIMEINQAWDFNDYWHNAKYPDIKQYKASCQPSLIYAVTIDTRNPMDTYVLNPVGHGHYAGKDGKLYTDISTLTSAKDIAKRIEVKLIQTVD